MLRKKCSLLRGTGDLVTKYMEKADILNTSFVPVFTGKVCPQASQTPEPGSRVCWSKELPPKEEDGVWKHFRKLETHKSVGSDTIHPRVLRELANVTKIPNSIPLFERP